MPTRRVEGRLGTAESAPAGGVSARSSLSEHSADLSLVVLKYLVRFVEDNYGTGKVEEIAAAAGVGVADLRAGTGWVSHEQFEIVIECARALMADDATFIKACAYKAQSLNGSMSLVISGALSPAMAYQVGTARLHLISRISESEFHARGRNRLELNYRTTKPESRLMCLTRVAQIRAFPTLWRAPPAHVEEHACVAWGDELCSYDVRVIETRRWVPPVLLAAAGAGAVRALDAVAGVGPAWWVGALGGALFGYWYEARRLAAANRGTQEHIDAAFVELAEAGAKAQRALRLSGRPSEQSEGGAGGELELDPASLTARLGGIEARLTRSQFAILRHLALRPNAWISAAALQREALASAASQPDASNVRYHAHQLRLRLHEQAPALVRFVHSEPGLGYMWSLAECNRRHCGERHPEGSVGAEES
jgi:hypothetical protein